MPDVIMPFGKYRGKRLPLIPLSYLCYCRWEMRIKDHGLKLAIEREIWVRVQELPCVQDDLKKWLKLEYQVGLEEGRERQPPQRDMVSRNELRARVAKWYSRMARLCHPDTGGNDQAMAAINNSLQPLKEILDIP